MSRKNDNDKSRTAIKNRTATTKHRTDKSPYWLGRLSSAK